MRTAIVLASVSLAAVTAGGIGAVVAASGTPPTPAAGIKDCLETYTGPNEYTRTVDCLNRLADQTSEQGQAAEFIAAMATYRQQDQIDDDLCHEISHELGAHEVGRMSYNVPVVIASMPTMPCASGVMHGALIAWGETRPSADNSSSVGALCRELAGGLPRANPSLPYAQSEDFDTNCADGFGHAMWEATLDPIQAMTRCTALEDELIRYCILGTGMQGAEPTPVRPNAPVDRATALTVIAPWCATLSDAEREGCGALLAIPFGAELESLAWQPEGTGTSERLAAKATTAIDDCSGLVQEDIARQCLSELTRRAHGRFDGNVAWLCPLLPGDSRQECREVAASEPAQRTTEASEPSTRTVPSS